MGIEPGQLVSEVIRPACEALGLWNQAAGELLLGTACQESGCGRYLRQLGGGPALGPFQMEPATHSDIYDNFIAYRFGLKDKLALLCKNHMADEMVWNLRYAAAMCRIHYFRVKDKLPTAGNLNGQAHYWKQYYNTPLGKGTVQEYVENWRLYVA